MFRFVLFGVRLIGVLFVFGIVIVRVSVCVHGLCYCDMHCSCCGLGVLFMLCVRCLMFEFGIGVGLVLCGVVSVMVLVGLLTILVC